MGRMEPVFRCEKLDKWWFSFYFSPNVPVSSATLASAHSWGTFCGVLLCNLMSLSPILCFVFLNITFISVNILRLDLSFGILQAQNIQHIVLISGFTSSNIGIWDKYWQKTCYDQANPRFLLHVHVKGVVLAASEKSVMDKCAGSREADLMREEGYRKIWRG